MKFEWNEQREAIFLDRYAAKDNGELLEHTPNEMFKRIAKAIAFNRQEELQFSAILEDFRFVPAGRILSGAGSKQHSATFYNCFVLGIEPDDERHGVDSRDAILNTISKMIEITCRGGGVGINWSSLRPDKSKVRGVHGISTGPIGWMRGADALADQVRQGGSRTAALMYVLDCWHPDVDMLISGHRFSRANFSITITNSFMEAVRSSSKIWNAIFPDTTDPAYDVLWDGDLESWMKQGRAVKYKKMDAQAIWEGICNSAIENGSPGLIFIDTCNTASNTWMSEKISCTNPCGEQPLPKYGSCNLGSINLVAFCGENGDIDRAGLRETIWGAVRFLDNVIEKSPPIYHKIDRLQKLYRRIGLGTMGLADVLILNKLRYGSEESIAFIRELYSFIRDEAYLASSDLARERGYAPAYNHNEFLSSHMARSMNKALRFKISDGKLRNLSILTEAPTGTTSILAGVSSGIEPVFKPEYTRKDAMGICTVKHPLFTEPARYYHVSAHDVTPAEHIAIQACLQSYTDSGISKTVNLPPCSKLKDVDEIFNMAYDMKVKGITVYKSGSLDDVLACKSCNI